MKRLKNKRGASVHSTKSTSLMIVICLLFALCFSVGCASRSTASAAVRSTEKKNMADGNGVTTGGNEGGIGLKTTTYNLNGVEFKMILVEGGTFTMGSDTRAKGRGTQVSNQAGEHRVSLSSYLIGETEVTCALWSEVMNSSHRGNDLNYPVASVTVPQCRTFVDRLNKKAHAAGIIPADRNFHMLTEAQWEFAAKGGNDSRGYTYAGSNTLSEVGWTSNDGGSAHAVKQKKPNELGIYDMSGNVYEWVADYAAPYSIEPQTDPCNTAPSNNYIKRGGSFYYNDDYRFTCTYRYFYSSTDNTIGLRIGLH